MDAPPSQWEFTPLPPMAPAQPPAMGPESAPVEDPAVEELAAADAAEESPPWDAAPVLATIAAVATVVLTGIAFWLSFEHLHDVAHGNGLGGDEVRAWAWPATVDLFIVIGEVLMLRASLKGHGMDWWAVALAASGSLGSIALNVAGVGYGADAMQYVVAAVPPVAALLAFGALMRQLHGHLAARTEMPAAAAAPAAMESTGAASAQVERVEPQPEALTEAPAERAQVASDERPSERPAPRPDERRPERAQHAQAKPKKSATKALAERRQERVRQLYDELAKRPEWTDIRDALAAGKLADKSISRSSCQRIRDAVEAKEPHLAALGSDNVRAITGS